LPLFLFLASVAGIRSRNRVQLLGYFTVYWSRTPSPALWSSISLLLWTILATKWLVAVSARRNRCNYSSEMPFPALVSRYVAILACFVTSTSIFQRLAVHTAKTPAIMVLVVEYCLQLCISLWASLGTVVSNSRSHFVFSN
jgi:hypothetical protein